MCQECIRLEEDMKKDDEEYQEWLKKNEKSQPQLRVYNSDIYAFFRVFEPE